MIDQFSDPSFRLLAQRILEVPEFEPLIKNASLDPDEHAALPVSAFAWEERRLFPIHTPEQAALSYLYATSKTASAVPQDVIETLEDTLRAYGIGLEIAMRKEASATPISTDTYLLPQLERWAVADAETVKIAEQALHHYGKDLPFEDQVQAAVRLVKKARDFGVDDLSIATAKLAGLTESDLDTTRNWVEARAALAPPSYTSAYMNLATTLQKTASHSGDRASLVKLASTIHELDTEAGLVSQYRKKIPDAMATVFNTSKIAEPMLELGGVGMRLSKLACLPKETYADVFGNDVLPEITTGGELDVEKIATVIPTMPNDLLRIFARQVQPYVR